ncbi:MAG: branched-chain amino acid ABC transporter permease [Candidatus Thorarchaeota archaeon]|jgi:branched-chain amino acid transport system permease protein
MSKIVRRSLHDSVVAVRNFIRWLPKGVKHAWKELPASISSLKFWVISFRGVVSILSLAGLIAIPLLTGSEYYTQILTLAMIYAIYAASWDLLAGYVGQVSFGHAIFFGIGGYITAASIRFLGFHWMFAIILGSLVAVLFSILIGIPCLRLRGPYLALGTLAFSLILFNLFSMGTFLGGTEGISGLPRTADPLVSFLIILGFMIGSIVLLQVVARSKIGTVFKSIRDDETCSDASGINTTKYKIAAFMISGFFAGIAGSLFALNLTAVNPAIFQPLYSFYAIIMASIGGIGTITGSIIGSFLFVVLSEILRPLAAAAVLIFATILIFIIRFADEGVSNPLLDGLQDVYDMIRGR